MLSMRRIGGALVAMAATAALVAPGASARTALASYTVSGTAMADATSAGVQIQVTGATKNALRVLDIGDAFSVSADGHTKWVVVSGLTPSRGTAADVDAGDKVQVTIRAKRNASVADLSAKAAARIADVTARVHPGGRPYWFYATVNGVDTTHSTLSVHVTDGNLNALRAMLGAPVDETFTYNASTVFTKGTRRGPVLISAGSLVAGDKISLAEWAPLWTPIATLTSTPLGLVHFIKH